MNMPHLSRLEKEIIHLDQHEQLWLMERLVCLLRETYERHVEEESQPAAAAEAGTSPVRRLREEAVDELEIEGNAPSEGSDSDEVGLSDAIDTLYDQLADLTSRVADEPGLAARIQDCRSRLRGLQAKEAELMRSWFEEHLILEPSRAWEALREADRILGNEDYTAQH